MTLPTESDLDALFSTNDFAVRCFDASGHQFEGILDRDYVETEQISGNLPLLTMKHQTYIDLGIALDSVLNIETYDYTNRRQSSTSYTVKGLRPDNFGTIDLVLVET